MNHNKVGHVSVWERTTGKWVIRYKDPYTRCDVGPLAIKASNYDMARDIARDHDKYCRKEVKERPDKREAAIMAGNGLTVEDALKQSEVKVAHRRERSLLNFRNDALHFQRYLKDKHKVTRWGRITCDLVDSYIQSMRKRGCSHDRIRLCLEPVRIASRFWWKKDSNHFKDFYTDAEVSLSRDTLEAEPVALEWDQAADFIEYLAEHHPLLKPMAVLILATGLRQYEAAWLRPCDIDHKRLTITLADTEHHKLKNKYAPLPIPFPSWALECVQSWPVNSEAPIFVTETGRPWAVNNLSKLWGVAITQARTKGVVGSEFTARNLRSTFATHASMSGVPDLIMQRMLRQAPKSVFMARYREIKIAEIRAKMGGLWEARLGIARKPSTEAAERVQ